MYFPLELNAGLVGLGLTYVISLADMLQYTIRLSADVENTVSYVKLWLELLLLVTNFFGRWFRLSGLLDTET